MKPRRILIFSLAYYPRFIGGAEVAVKEITDRIPSEEIQFDMVTLRKHAPAFERIGTVNVYRVGLPWFGTRTQSSRIFPLSKILYILLAVLKAIRLHRTQRYDAVWPIMASYAGFSAYVFKWFFPSVPMILTIQEGDHFERRAGWLKSFFVRIFKKADHIQVISNFLRTWSLQMGAMCPITLVPNGVDVSLFSKRISDAEARTLKTALGKKDDDVFLITTSRLVAKNAVGDVIKALEYLPTNVKFLILGTGQLEAELKAQVAAMLPEYDMSNRVQFLGFVAHAELPKYLQVSDIFIRPSLSEGLGNSFLEAMAAGIPVIATRVGGIPDFLVDGVTGLFCEVNNPKNIAQKVEKLIKDRESRTSIVEQAREMVDRTYSWEGVVLSMKKVFAEMMK